MEEWRVACKGLVGKHEGKKAFSVVHWGIILKLVFKN